LIYVYGINKRAAAIAALVLHSANADIKDGTSPQNGMTPSHKNEQMHRDRAIEIGPISCVFDTDKYS